MSECDECNYCHKLVPKDDLVDYGGELVCIEPCRDIVRENAIINEHDAYLEELRNG